MNIKRKKAKGNMTTMTNMHTNPEIDERNLESPSSLSSVNGIETSSPEIPGIAGNQGEAPEKSLGNDREIHGNSEAPTQTQQAAVTVVDPVRRLFKWADRCELSDLNHEDESRILELLEEHTYARVRDIIAQPRPDGFNCRTSISTLQRFYAGYRAELMEEEAAVARDQIEIILQQAGDDDEAFYKAARHLLKRRLLETSISPTGKTDEICRLFGMLERIRLTDIAERRLALDEDKAA